jgi:hypothetical protein
MKLGNLFTGDATKRAILRASSVQAPGPPAQGGTPGSAGAGGGSTPQKRGSALSLDGTLSPQGPPSPTPNGEPMRSPAAVTFAEEPIEGDKRVASSPPVVADPLMVKGLARQELVVLMVPFETGTRNKPMVEFSTRSILDALSTLIKVGGSRPVARLAPQHE